MFFLESELKFESITTQWIVEQQLVAYSMCVSKHLYT